MRPGRRRGACRRETSVHATDTRCNRRDDAWVGSEREPEIKPKGDGRGGSGGAVLAAAPLSTDRSAKGDYRDLRLVDSATSAPTLCIAAPTLRIAARTPRIATPALRIAAPALRIATPALRIATPALRIAARPLRIAAPTLRTVARTLERRRGALRGVNVDTPSPARDARRCERGHSEPGAGRFEM
jgi:hypothetical protein